MTVVAPAEARRFRLLPGDWPSLETEVLALWESEHLFAKTLEAAEGRPAFVFYEGPPTANGRPGIHHVFSRTLKDLVCRHRSMRGFYVPRKAGWDTHGLPVEIEVEKSLGITAKAQIEALGVARFNELCRDSVWTYRSDWERLSERIGYWLDYASPYITYSPTYIESVWWALATLWGRGLLYPGHKILPYCPRCETALSSHELALGYRDVEDPSVYVAFDLVEPGRRILVWTTTPWTLVSNAALAVNPDLQYVELKARSGDDQRTLMLAEARVAPLLGPEFESKWEIVGRHRGADLAGLRYHRPLDWVPYPETGEHEIVLAETFVTAEDGSGVVHLSPAFGADDYAAGQRRGLAFLQPVTNRGAFAKTVPVVGDLFVKEADKAIIAELRKSGRLWRGERLTHSYPHCWRCGTPLLYYARSSWFVRTTAFRDAMVARNARVGWHPPETGSGRFGEWLAGNIDWAISRDRYWGTPLPVWVCNVDPSHVEVIDSFGALAAAVGRPLPADFDPHKPTVDGYEWACRACQAAGGAPGTMRRVTEVIDAWFDSGSMSFAQWHYPFEHKERVDQQFPADFICEGVDQTRGWFYSLLAIATGLGNALPHNDDGTAAPFRNVIVNDLVLDAHGQKMSKSRGNAVDPWTVIGEHGADAIRFFLIESSQVWVPRRFDEQGIRDSAGRLLITLKNTYDGIFAQYANFGWAPSALDPAPADRPLLDRWVLSRLAHVEHEADASLQQFEPTLAARTVRNFIDDDVSKWYVRLSRSRFYDVDSPDSRAAFATLHEVLTVTARLLAPVMPFVTDWLHRELVGTSVHLAPYVRPGPGATTNDGLESAMTDIRRLATLAHGAREGAKIKTRRPLSRLVCVVPRGAASRLADLRALAPLLAAELNVKAVEWLTSADSLVRLTAKANFRSLGKKFGTHTPEAARAVGQLTGDQLRSFEQGGALSIQVAGESRSLDPEDVIITHGAAGDLVVQEGDGYLAALDATITPELAAEGLARELVSGVQRMRKEAGFAVSDRIRVLIVGDAAVAAAASAHREWIMREVLAHDLDLKEEGIAQALHGPTGRTAPSAGTRDRMDGFDAVRALDLDGHSVRIALTREVDS
jgi:isoleucyl-tRNA synthetase